MNNHSHLDKIKNFFKSKEFAVIGASNDKTKYGNKILRCYLQHQYNAWPVNPKESIIEGIKTYHTISELPQTVESISIITPPKITDSIIEEIPKTTIKNIWMQPGSESVNAIKRCHDLGLNVIANGPCLLVYLGFHD